MNLTMVLQAGKIANALFNSRTKKAKNVVNEQKKTQMKYYQYNKKQLEEVYNRAFTDNMTNYITEKMNITEQYKNIETQLNHIASQSGVNLGDTSYNNDAQSQLDLEFKTNLQNSMSNMMNKAVDLIMYKTGKDTQLLMEKNDNINKINNSFDKMKDNAYDKIAKEFSTFGGYVVEDYTNWKSKEDLKSEEDKKTGIKNYLTDELLKFKF